MKIIVYDDNPDFGGHQIMACHGIEALAADPANEVICMLNPENTKLSEKLVKLDSCQYVESPCATRSLQGIRNRMDRRGIHQLTRLFESHKADVILCIQGDIEQSSQAPIAARKAGIPCISYIALPHRRSSMGARLGRCRDRANQYLLSQPSQYIAISDSMAALLRERGAEQPVAIVPNGIEIPDATFTPHASSITLGLLGRIEFKQKQQDFMVRAFCDAAQAFESARLVITGDGPDWNRLEQLVTNGPRANDIELKPWENDIDAFFASIDMLVIPSRYEGVPLVMLEALARGIPVIGSARDGMRDILPGAWTFEPENTEALATAFSAARDTWQKEIGLIQQRILNEHALDVFKEKFVSAVLSAT